MAGSSEHGNEISDSIKAGNLTDSFSRWTLLLGVSLYNSSLSENNYGLI
jgi:hypothetical protein